MKNEIIKINNVSKKYKLGEYNSKRLKDLIINKINHKEEKWFYALKDIDLIINKGETIGILGKNGAGKSTLLKLISNITIPSSGTIDLYGRVTSLLEVGTGFHRDMTGRENIYLSGSILGMKKSEINKKINDIIAFSELEEFIDTPVKRYSSGMYVKLAFSVAIYLNSEIIIMDEVFAVSDDAFQKKCIKKLLDFVKEDNKTIIFVSHNLNIIEKLCNRCIILNEGKIVFDGNTKNAIKRYREDFS